MRHRRLTTIVAFAAFGVAMDRLTAQTTFANVTSQSGLIDVPRDSLLFGGGVCCGDFDGDEDVDIVVPGSAGAPIRYFRNDGGMQFGEIPSALTGLGSSLGGRATTSIDVDADGDLDIYVGNWHQPVQLFINDGTGSFVDEAAARGLTHISSNWSASFGDFDRDGHVDLYVGNREQSSGLSGVLQGNLLFRNIGAGRFVDVTVAAGLDAAVRATFVAAFFDYDEDSWPDLLVGQDKGLAFGPNQLFRSQGDGTFIDFAPLLQADDAIDAMGLDFVDAFNDGGFDYYCSDLEPTHLFRVWDPTQSQFVDETARWGVQGGRIGWAVHFADLDNDGWQDLHVVHSNGPNARYRNTYGDHFGQPGPAPAWTLTPGINSPAQNSAVLADFDGDGRIDILNRIRGADHLRGGLALLRNTSPQRNWLKVECVGRISNRDGLGARVEVTTVHPGTGTPVTQRQFVRSGVGFQSGNVKTLHFGLADAATAKLRVVWPTGQSQDVGEVAANRLQRVTESQLRLIGTPRLGATCRLRMASPDDVGTHYMILLAAHDMPKTVLGDGRVLPLQFDALSAATLMPGNGLIHGNHAALLRDVGEAALTIPNDPGVVGLRIFAAGLTYSPTAGVVTNVVGAAVSIDIVP